MTVTRRVTGHLFRACRCRAAKKSECDRQRSRRALLHCSSPSAPSFLWRSRCLLAIANQQRIRARCAGDDLALWILASDRAQVLFEIFKAHRCELLALGRLRHRPAPFRVTRPAATTNIAIAASATAQSRTMIRRSLFMVAPPDRRRSFGDSFGYGRRFLRRERCHDFFKARIATQRVPHWIEFEIAVVHANGVSCRGRQLFEC
jgi:hypothetical protein